jgi:hypothetical protein
VWKKFSKKINRFINFKYRNRKIPFLKIKINYEDICIYEKETDSLNSYIFCNKFKCITNKNRFCKTNCRYRKIGDYFG